MGGGIVGAGAVAGINIPLLNTPSGARPSGGPAAADFVPLRAQHRISAKENQTDGDRAQQYFAIRGMRQGGQGAIKALGLLGADREGGLENDHADQGKDDAPRR